MMGLIGEEKKMTVKEVADALSVDTSSVSRRVRELFPEIVKNGVPTLLNEHHVTELKAAFLQNGKLGDIAKVENAVTDLEKQQTIMLAVQYLQEGYDAMKARAIEAERKNAVLMHSCKLYTATEIAKELGYRSAQELNEQLHMRGVQYKQNGTWIPCADYSDLGYFSIKQNVLDNGTIIYDRKITQDGRTFILELLSV